MRERDRNRQKRELEQKDRQIVWDRKRESEGDRRRQIDGDRMRENGDR